MTTVNFLIAGQWHDLDNVHLTTRDRRNATGTIFHNNKYSSVYRIPVEFFKEHFKYERKTNIYRTTLKYGDIKQFREVLTHNG